MRKLDRKLLRDLAHMKGQAVAIIAVIAAGIAVFVMSMCAYASLKHGQEQFYRENRFADVFALLHRCPNSMVPRLRALEGVAEVSPRLEFNVLLNVPEMVEPATARLISVPDGRPANLNQLYIARGRRMEQGRSDEVVVSEGFADAHGFRPGDQVQAILNGKSQTLTIVGIALSPEYVIQIQGGSLLPDQKRFGIFWMGQEPLESAFDMSGAFNSVSLKLDHGTRVEGVIEALDRWLEPYGCVGAFDRSDQLSHQYVTDELFQLRTTATLAPAIFLSVAAFLLNLVVSRIVSQQREQIAALKAFGYSNWEVGTHYLSLAMIISLAGVVAGTALGIWMGSHLTEMYQEFYRFPRLQLVIDELALVIAILLTSASAIVGTWVSVRRAIHLPPAEAMRPEPPPTYRPTFVERWFPAGRMPPEFRMTLRNVARKPIKMAISVLGIGLSVAVLILGSFSLDALNFLIEVEFRQAQRQDLMVNFVEPATASVIYEIAQLDGVMASETMRMVPSRIRFQHRSRRVALMGLDPDPALFRLLSDQQQPVRIPDHGIMLNRKLAELLGVRLGDTITCEILEGARPVEQFEVTAVVSEFSGINAYLRKSNLHRRLRESEVASGCFLKVDQQQIEQVFAELERRPGVANVSIKDAAISSFRDTIAENMLTMRTFNVLFAIVIAIGVVYNSARISLSEQSRDLATMRVIGFSRREVATVLLGEIILVTALAIPVGWLMGYLFAAGLITGLDTENYRIPLVINTSTYGFASAVVIAATVVSGLIVQRRIANLDLIAVLKTRE